MVVEDDHDLRVTIRSLLEQAGYDVLSAAHGQQAIAMLAATSPELMPKVVVLDLWMPVMDGWQLAGVLQEHPTLNTLPMIVVTVDRGDPPAGVKHVLRKPFALVDLLQLVKHYCG
jgi:CheY-like chemotaxis protein